MKQQYPQRLRRPLATLALFAALSLPALAVNTSLSSDGASVSGAINDGLFYSIGGGSVISPPPSRSNMSRLGLNGGWSSDLMCGNFDLKTTVGNQLNGITSGFKDLMGNVIQGATGAVMSMPAMAIQRANPGLYEMLTNGVLQAGLSYDKALLNCQNMSKKLADYTLGSKWQQAAVAEEYKESWLRAAGMPSPATSNCRRPPVKKVSPGSAARSAEAKASRPFSRPVTWRKPVIT